MKKKETLSPFNIYFISPLQQVLRQLSPLNIIFPAPGKTASIQILFGNHPNKAYSLKISETLYEFHPTDWSRSLLYRPHFFL
jgi:hypothetical protein